MVRSWPLMLQREIIRAGRRDWRRPSSSEQGSLNYPVSSIQRSAVRDRGGDSPVVCNRENFQRNSLRRFSSDLESGQEAKLSSRGGCISRSS